MERWESRRDSQHVENGSTPAVPSGRPNQSSHPVRGLSHGALLVSWTDSIHPRSAASVIQHSGTSSGTDISLCQGPDNPSIQTPEFTGRITPSSRSEEHRVGK